MNHLALATLTFGAGLGVGLALRPAPPTSPALTDCEAALLRATAALARPAPPATYAQPPALPALPKDQPQATDLPSEAPPRPAPQGDPIAEAPAALPTSPSLADEAHADRIRAEATCLASAPCQLPRAELDAVLSDPSALAASLRIVPHLPPPPAPRGLKLVGIRPGTLPTRLGARNGDVLLRALGHAVTDPTAAIEALAAARAADHLTFGIERRGVPLTLHVQLIP